MTAPARSIADVEMALLGHDLATRRRFRDMATEQRRYVSAQWQRHVRACRAAEIDTEPQFLPELILDVLHGFADSE